MDVAKDVSVGVTLNFVSGSYTYDRQFAETDPFAIYTHYVPNVTTDMSEFDWNSTIKSDMTGFNALFGIMYRKQGKFRIGATVRTPTTLEITETFNDSYRVFGHSLSPYPADGPSVSSGETKYTVITPYVLSFGASIQPIEALVLAGDAEYTDWTQVQFDSNDPYLVAENQAIKTGLFRETWNLRGGAEFSLVDLGLKLRAGMVYKPSPYQADAGHTDRDELYYTGGIGIALEGGTSVNVAYSYGTWKTFRYNYSIAGIPEASKTDEAVKNSLINVTLAFRF
jgi:long-subunit fatty acid transport protein